MKAKKSHLVLNSSKLGRSKIQVSFILIVLFITSHSIGPDQWPIGCSLRFLSGAQLTSVDRVLVEPLLPNQSGDISVDMFSPSQPGTYEGQWRMTTSNGMFFGGKKNILLLYIFYCNIFINTINRPQKLFGSS